MSWNNFINGLFDWCVHILLKGAHLFGISYNEINIWVFCIIEPLVFIGMLYIIIRQMQKIRKLKKAIAK
ncbi:MAG: hypothetical protein HY841_03315 [Bacteroidetes bacterium]|nr:hypothetical protein [Bacteroidota bacterium]